MAYSETALFGTEVEGAARWVRLGGLNLQPSLVLLPMILGLFARSRSASATAGVLLAVVAMALQPDRAMAGMLVLCLATLAMIRRDRHIGVALTASVIGFTMTLARLDTLPAVPYVDEVLYSAFSVHVAAGLAVVGGVTLLLIPAIVGWRRDPSNRATYAAFGTVWLAAIIAAALGNYPTPVVGYGGSAIIGYVLSLIALPRRAAAHTGMASQEDDTAPGSLFDRHLPIVPA